jgi:hypothetical protein
LNSVAHSEITLLELFLHTKQLTIQIESLASICNLQKWSHCVSDTDFEDLITKAKKSDLHGRRMVLSSLSTVAASHKLVDEIAPKLTGRTSGHLRIKKTRLRTGDNAQLAEVSFVDDITAVAAPVAEEKPKAAAKAVKAGK